MAHSPALADKIADFMDSVNRCADPRGALLEGVSCLGPGCFFDDLENGEQANGAIALLSWLQAYLEA